MLVYQVLTGINIGVSGAFPYFGAWLAKLLNLHPEDWSIFQIEGAQEIINGGIFKYDISVLIIGILLGSLITAIATHNFKLHRPEALKETGFYALGGLLMGYGSYIAGGCNLSGFLSSAANLSLSAWVYLIFMMLGGLAVIRKL